MADLDQQAVAGRVSQAVVDDLEAIQVDEQHCQLVAEAIAAGERVVDAVQEEGTIGQACQRVVERAMAELRLEHFPLRGAAERAGGVLGQLTRATLVDSTETARVENETNEAHPRLLGSVIEGKSQA